MNNRGANWLGDDGNSGDYFGVDARYFDVVLPTNSNLVLVVNNTLTGGGGLGQPFDIAITAFGDTQYGDPVLTPVPEPSTLMLAATGLAGLAGAVRRRLKR